MKHALGAMVVLMLISLSGKLAAEPYIAVATGFKCAQCHTNAAGGGKRTAFGAAYAANELAKRVISLNDGDGGWNGEVNRWIAVGADLRTGFDYDDTPGQEERSQFEVSRGAVYVELRAIPNFLTFYVDEQIAPGGTLNREAYGLLTPGNGKYRIKAGKFFLPYGLRLQDDTAFVRELTGMNFATPDTGAEFGLELNKWSAQIAVSNGTAGAPDNDPGKQVSASASYVMSRWRVGASYNTNNSDLGDRDMQGVFVGLRTGPISWLGEIDRITDDVPGPDRDIQVSLLEGNWRFAKGHNLKVSYEFHDPDDVAEEDERERYSLVWEYTPFQLMQSRVGVRAYNGVPGSAPTNRDEFFAELHVYF